MPSLSNHTPGDKPITCTAASGILKEREKNKTLRMKGTMAPW